MIGRSRGEIELDRVKGWKDERVDDVRGILGTKFGERSGVGTGDRIGD